MLWSGVKPESMLWSQSLYCGARVYVVEPESMLWSQSLCYGASVYGIVDFSVSSPLGTYPTFFLVDK